MFYQDVIEKVKEVAAPLLEERGFELVEVRYHGRNKPVLSLLIDRVGGGVTIDECALMNSLLSDALDKAEVFSTAYILEVSSPGVDRLLKQKNDFSRVTGKKIKCFLSEAIEGKLEIEGIVNAAGDDAVTLETAAGNVDIPYVKINKARQVIG